MPRPHVHRDISHITDMWILTEDTILSCRIFVVYLQTKRSAIGHK